MILQSNGMLVNALVFAKLGIVVCCEKSKYAIP